MSMRHHARALVALTAAYAVALQAILLAVGGPAAGAAQFAALPICSTLGAGHGAPAGHGNDCRGACLAGCCHGATVLPGPEPAIVRAPMPQQSIIARIVPPPLLLRSATGAHRCRAPPLA
jgi:hypothetical protein